MKKILLLSLLLLPAWGASAKPKVKHAKKVTKVRAVAWRTDFDAALKEARRSRKLVFVDIYTDWCGPCKYLDATTYKDPKFVRASRDWVMVKVNAEKGARNMEVGMKYSKGFYPTLLMLDARGKKLNQLTGAYPAALLIPEMRKAQGGLSAKNSAAPRLG